MKQSSYKLNEPAEKLAEARNLLGLDMDLRVPMVMEKDMGLDYEGTQLNLPVIGQIRKCKIPFHLTSKPPIFIRIDVIQGRSNDAISRRQNDVLYPILVTPKWRLLE